VGNLVHNVRLGATIHSLVAQFPNFEIETEVQPITRTVLRIKVTLKPKFVWTDKVHGGTAELLWLFVEDSNNNFIFHHEQVLLKRKEVKAGTPLVINITVPIVPEYDRYSVRVVSDRWLGCEDEQGFSVAHLHLPDDAVPHTPLLPLHPISKHAIPERYHRAYPGFSQFNAVQSQCFHVMMHTDHNVLLGAPTGSGKTICAELAMLRVFERNHLAKLQWLAQREQQQRQQEQQDQTEREEGAAAAAAAAGEEGLAAAPPRPAESSGGRSGKQKQQQQHHHQQHAFHPEKIVYIAPLKALVKERMKDWRARFVDMLGLSVVELSGDVTPDIISALATADVLCATPEKWDGLSRNWQVRSYIASVALVVFDEVHMLGGDRGPILEVIVSRMRYIGWHRGRPVRLIGLSTAVSNPSDMAFWLGVTKRAALFNFHPSTRPVPMRVHISGYPGKNYCPRMAIMNKPTYNAIVEKSPSKPVIVFVSSRRQTRLTAMALINFLLLEDNSAKFVRMTADEVRHQLELISDAHLKHCVQFGIGIHHAGLCESDKALMEDLYRSGRLQILVATSTLAWGVNFPAHLVIVKGTEFYDAKTKSYVDQSLTDILQQIGRAGRPQYDTEGVAVVLCHEPKKSFFRKFLYDPFPVESALHKQLHAHINAEIVAGTIATRQDAVDYLTWTYLFRRLAKNPSYYGLSDATPKALTLYLSTLVRRVLSDLEMAGCLESPRMMMSGGGGGGEDDDGEAESSNSFDPNVLRHTVLGKICSYYYLSHETAAFFNTAIDPNDDHGVLLKKLCDATEFAELPVRHNEDKMNMELARSVPMGIDQRMADSPHVKAFLLFQAHMERAKLPIVDYHTDMRSAIDNSIRTLQALVDITANNGHLFAVLRAMNLMQCMVQARWWHSPTLLQLPHLGEEHLPALKAAGITHVSHLVHASLDTLERFRGALRLGGRGSATALTEEHVAELVDAAKRLPLIDVHAEVSRKAANAEEEAQEEEVEDETYEVKVDLTRLSQMSKFVVAPKFAKQKDEQYWLVLGHEPTGELVALKRINRLFRRASATLVFDWDAELWARSDRISLYVICDSYIGLDQHYHLKMPFQQGNQQ
jgi:activating signal cointegrator complex subunit 3